MESLDLIANKFTQAFYEKKWPGYLKPPVSQLSTKEAYVVQDKVKEKRVERGEEVVGFKVGCTSEAIRTQFGLSEPISGRLFHPHVYNEGLVFNWKDFNNCAIEPEMVLSMGADLQGIGLSRNHLLEAIAWVSPGIELHNYKFWFNPPTSQELICSGGLHAGLIVGNTKVLPGQLSFAQEIFSVRKNGKQITAAPATEIMGGPLQALQWLVDSLTQRGLILKKGSLVIPGSPVKLIPINQEVEMCVEIEDVGTIVTRFISDDA